VCRISPVSRQGLTPGLQAYDSLVASLKKNASGAIRPMRFLLAKSQAPPPKDAKCEGDRVLVAGDPLVLKEFDLYASILSSTFGRVVGRGRVIHSSSERLDQAMQRQTMLGDKIADN